MAKPFINILLGLCTIIVLSGCPYNSAHTIDEQPQQLIDETMLGKWATMVTRVVNDRVEKQNPVKLILTQKNEMEYNVAITGYLDDLKPWIRIEEDTIKGTAFLSTLAERQFLNISIQYRNYVAEVKKGSGTLSIYPMSDRFTSKFIKNSSSLRTALEVHFKTRPYPGYDEQFMLKDMIRVN